MFWLVVAFGDPLVLGCLSVFRYDLWDLCMLLSCTLAFLKKIILLVFHPCFQGSPGGALHLVSEPKLQHWDLCVMLPLWFFFLLFIAILCFILDISLVYGSNSYACDLIVLTSPCCFHSDASCM